MYPEDIFVEDEFKNLTPSSGEKNGWIWGRIRADKKKLLRLSLSEEGLSVQYAFSLRISNNQSGDIRQPRLTDGYILRLLFPFNNDKFCHILLPKKAIYIYTQ